MLVCMSNICCEFILQSVNVRTKNHEIHLFFSTEGEDIVRRTCCNLKQVSRSSFPQGLQREAVCVRGTQRGPAGSSIYNPDVGKQNGPSSLDMTAGLPIRWLQGDC